MQSTKFVVYLTLTRKNLADFWLLLICVPEVIQMSHSLNDITNLFTQLF